MSIETKVKAENRHRRDVFRTQLGQYIVRACSGASPNDRRLPPHLIGLKIGPIKFESQTSKDLVPEIFEKLAFIYPDLPPSVETQEESKGLVLDQEWQDNVRVIEGQAFGHRILTPQGSPFYQTLVASDYFRVQDDPLITNLASEYMIAHEYSEGFMIKGLADITLARELLEEKVAARADGLLS